MTEWAEEEQRNPAWHTPGIQRIKFQCFSCRFIIPHPHPPTRWACTCGWKRYPTLPLHMTVWWFTPSVSPSHLTRWPSLLCTWLCWEETLCSERLRRVGGRGGRYGSTHIQALKVEQMLRLVIMWMFWGICGGFLPSYFNEIKWFEI